jgi:hypothetical protein
MRIGLILEHYDGRNDVRELVSRLAERHELMIFASRGVLEKVGGEVPGRAFDQRLTFAQRCWLQLFNFVGEVPRSRDNVLITETFKFANVECWRRYLAMLRLRVRLVLPGLLSFDVLLRHLEGCDRTRIDDVDNFLIITELTSPCFLAHVLAAGKPVDAYVYSWDHACKHTKVSRRIRRWFVWHEGIRDDLVQLQGIDADSVRTVGATQLAYVREYLEKPDLRLRRRDGRYMYYGCGTGHPAMAEQEARLIAILAQVLHGVDPSVTLLVRPYPFLAGTRCLQDLAKRPNVELDLGYREGKADNSLRREDIFARLNMQEHSLAFVHCGTTMGLEGAYLPAPVLFLDLQDVDYGGSAGSFLHLQKFIHQYHNDRYMIVEGFPNVIRSRKQLESVLRRVLAEPEEFMGYNAAIASAMPLRALPEIARDMVA